MSGRTGAEVPDPAEDAEGDVGEGAEAEGAEEDRQADPDRGAAAEAEGKEGDAGEDEEVQEGDGEESRFPGDAGGAADKQTESARQGPQSEEKVSRTFGTFWNIWYFPDYMTVGK